MNATKRVNRKKMGHKTFKHKNGRIINTNTIIKWSLTHAFQKDKRFLLPTGDTSRVEHVKKLLINTSYMYSVINHEIRQKDGIVTTTY